MDDQMEFERRMIDAMYDETDAADNVGYCEMCQESCMENG